MNLPSIPDNLYKTLILIGVVLIGYFYFYKLEPLNIQINQLDKSLIKITDSLSNKINSFENEVTQLSNETKKLGAEFDELAKLMSTKNVLNEMKYTNQKYKIVSDKLQIKLEERMLINKQIIAVCKSNRDEQNIYYNDIRFCRIFIYIGIVSFIIGFAGLITHQRIQDELIKRQMNEKEFYYEFCQSCGKKFNSIITYSTNHDGTKNKAFCISCYENGQFKNPNLTFEELKMLTLEASIFKKNIIYRLYIVGKLKGLDRWKNNQYGL